MNTFAKFQSNDGMLNEETLNQKLIEETANDTKWASTIDPVFRKCVAAGNLPIRY